MFLIVVDEINSPNNNFFFESSVGICLQSDSTLTFTIHNEKNPRLHPQLPWTGASLRRVTLELDLI